MNENVISAAFDYYTEKYNQARQYGDILRRVDEEIDGLGSVTMVTIATELDTNIYTLVNGWCVSVKRAWVSASERRHYSFTRFYLL